MLPFAAIAQTSEKNYYYNPQNIRIETVDKIDTVRATLHITNSKLSKIQLVPGYVLLQNGRVKGYLSRQRKTFPKKVEVWGYH